MDKIWCGSIDENHVVHANLGCKCTYIVSPSDVWIKENQNIKNGCSCYLYKHFLHNCQAASKFSTHKYTWLLWWWWLWYDASYVCACKSYEIKTLLPKFWDISILLEYTCIWQTKQGSSYTKFGLWQHEKRYTQEAKGPLEDSTHVGSTVCGQR